MTRREALDALEDRARKMEPAERDSLAEQLVEEGAAGEVFERLHRAGWRTRSMRRATEEQLAARKEAARLEAELREEKYGRKERRRG